MVWLPFSYRPRPSKHPHEMTPTTLGIETMDASSVRDTRIDVTIRASVSGPLSNCDQIVAGLLATLARNTKDALTGRNEEREGSHAMS